MKYTNLKCKFEIKINYSVVQINVHYDSALTGTVCFLKRQQINSKLSVITRFSKPENKLLSFSFWTQMQVHDMIIKEKTSGFVLTRDIDS